MNRTEIQNVLEGLGVRARRSLGQNFLHDGNLARWIVGRLNIEPDDHIVEIGPGLGALTRLLPRDRIALTLIEKDRRLAGWLRENFAPEGVELFHMDALVLDLRTLYGRGPVKILGNLPYYISTPLIAKYTSALSPASMLVLTLQQEVAERLVATPGTKQFGAMTVCCSRRWNIRCARKLPPSVFHPKPQVSSAVVVFERKAPADVVPCDEGFLFSLVRRGFAERRKQLRGLLPEYRSKWPEVCAALRVKETIRAEELSLGEWERLSELLRPVTVDQAAEKLCVVDARDRVIGSESRESVHVNNLRHRATHTLIFNRADELFLQKRSIWKDTHPGKWDSSAAGHTGADESYEASARRELREEIGIDCPIAKVGKLPCSAATGWEFIEVFRGRHEGPFTLDSMELETGAFFFLDKIKAWLERRPQDFSPVFAMCLELLSN
jgi:16S rRNA (adenine1518-N6/adenine1519-N6)-dimethyltransferase